jgi:hypothetical protein
LAAVQINCNKHATALQQKEYPAFCGSLGASEARDKQKTLIIIPTVQSITGEKLSSEWIYSLLIVWGHWYN